MRGEDWGCEEFIIVVLKEWYLVGDVNYIFVV